MPSSDPDGTKYTLRLIPENDVGHHVVVLDVSLSRSNGKESKSNLLEPQGRWHGYQPYIFAASDFAQGGNGSRGQNSRTFYLRSECKSRLRLRVSKLTPHRPLLLPRNCRISSPTWLYHQATSHWPPTASLILLGSPSSRPKAPQEG